MDPEFAILWVDEWLEVVSPACEDDRFSRCLRISSFIVNRRPRVGEVRYHEVTLLEQLQYPIIDVLVMLFVLNMPCIYPKLSERRSHEFAVDSVGIFLADAHCDEAFQFLVLHNN